MPKSKKNKDKSKTLIGSILIALVLGLVLSVFLYLFTVPKRTTSYVFNADYPVGTQITRDMLSPIQMDQTIIVDGTKREGDSFLVTADNFESVLNSGDTLRMDVSQGMPLTKPLLTIAGSSSVEVNMNPESIAVSVGVDNITGVYRDLREGARVNVYSSMQEEDLSTKLLFSNVRILATSNTEAGDLVAVTLEIDKGEAQNLIHATTYGSIYLGLVDFNASQGQEVEE